ncbi:hypothetical protein OK074_4823 [Actinobacteria bacterium OK074]|nr:hypothetical protein OK074_4823 [Actinobacteria bacterium OK074]
MRLTHRKVATGAVGAAVTLLALAGCSSGGSAKAEAKVPATATGSLEELAADVDCKPNLQTDADEIRQAICDTDDGKYILLTFATDRGQREWLNTAEDYGGYFLVGRKWTVSVGKEKVVDALQGRLGGTIEVGASHASHQ